MKKVFIYLQDTCEKRELDARRISQYLIQNNYKIINNPTQADIIIFVSCAALNEIIDRALEQIQQFLKCNADLIVTGCLPEIASNKLSTIFNGKTLRIKELKNIDSLFPEHTIKFDDIDDANFLLVNRSDNATLGVLKKSLKNIPYAENIYCQLYDYVLYNLYGTNSILYRWFSKRNPPFNIRISRGCLGNCSFCAVKKSIGIHKSKPIEQCIDEFTKGLKQGYTHFSIVADDTGAYGLDIGCSFPELLDKITAFSGDYKISILGVHPTWIVKYIDYLEKILKRKKIISIDVPIQSGSERILKLMDRYSHTENMKSAFLRLKKSYMGLSLNTYIILGFPSETGEEFRETLSFIKETSFHAGLIFLFSCMEDTRAEEIHPKLSQQEMLQRLHYTKKYLKNIEYKVIYKPEPHFFLFIKKDSPLQ